MPDALTAIRSAAARALDAHVPSGAKVAVALSGGRDSVVLLDALACAATARGNPLAAIHVHHGLSARADAWARFCADLCRERGVPFTLRAIAVPRLPQTSLESEARRLRYAALADAAATAGVSIVALAHHRDDQAETLLLQLLRGAGPHGLAAMALTSAGERGITWLRPLLDIPRAAIDTYARAASLSWVDDDSNADDKHLRNALRHRVLPVLAALAPGCTTTLARVAAHQAEAALLADDLAALDARDACADRMLDRATLAALPPYRARNLLRWFLRQQHLPAPSTARLAAMLEQLRRARTDANVCIAHAGTEIGVHRGRIVVHAPAPPAIDIPWCGESELVLPHGRLVFDRASGSGLDERRLAGAPVRIRTRAGGERFQLAADRPRRALKAILQEAGIPQWERRALPLVFCGDRLAAVADVGIDAAFRAAPESPGITVAWHRN